MDAFAELLRPPVLMVVAHWDDELVSAGTALVKHGTDWDVACVTRRDNCPQLGEVFERVCRACGARPIRLEVPHRTIRYGGNPGDAAAIREWSRRAPSQIITTQLLGRKLADAGVLLAFYNTIITHHPDGDTGRHVQHKQIAAAIRRMVPHGRIVHFSFDETTVAVEGTPQQQDRRRELLGWYRGEMGPHWHSGPRPMRLVDYFVPAGECGV